MPKHYAVGENVQMGTVNFDGTKTMTVWFQKPFSHVPSVTLTLGDVNNAPPYRTVESTTKMNIRFRSSYIGKVHWVAMSEGGV
jgi:hypothetical protein